MERFLPLNQFPLPLDPAKPVAMGDFGPPIIYTEAKWAQEVNLRESKEMIFQAWREFADVFGRSYRPVECYQQEQAKVFPAEHVCLEMVSGNQLIKELHGHN